MSRPEHEGDGPSITTLKSHDVLHIFAYLECKDLLQCRLVCPHWYELIKHEPRLIDKFRYEVTLDAGSVVSTEEPPFSIMLESKVKLKRITIKKGFLEPGNGIAVVDSNRLTLAKLSGILTDTEATNTVTEMVVHASDDELRTNEFLFQFILKMKALRVLRFALTAFVHSVEIISSSPESFEQCQSLEHVQIIHSDCKRLILPDFRRLLHIFPNINRIDVTTTEAMLLGEDIVQTLPHLIKSLETLECYTLIELSPELSLSHFSYECSTYDPNDVELLYGLINAQQGIETMNLKLLDGSSEFFQQPFERLIDLDLKVEKSPLGKILQWTPNLKKISVRYKAEHPFGHDVIDMQKLVDVTMAKFSLDCQKCLKTMLKSISNVKSLTLTHLSGISVKQLTLISNCLKHLEHLELMFEYSVDLQNHFARWPAMPKLKALSVNRVGHITNKAITNLQKSCPLLEVLKLYSIRGAKINGTLKLIFNSFPNLGVLTFRGGRCANIPQLNFINGTVGWRLQKLDVSANIEASEIIKLFKNNTFLEIVRCKYGSIEVTRRIYYEVEVLKAYSLVSVEQPLKNRRRLHLFDDMSSDSETSDSEESSSGSSYETVDEFD